VKHFIVAGLVAGFIVWPDAYASKAKEAKEFFLTASKEVLTQKEAARRLIVFKGEEIWRCNQVTISDKLTIVRKK
jgi:hypothetical protein